MDKNKRLDELNKEVSKLNKILDKKNQTKGVVKIDNKSRDNSIVVENNEFGEGFSLYRDYSMLDAKKFPRLVRE